MDSIRPILGVDPSTHLGWAIVDRAGYYCSGTIHVGKDAHKYRIRRFEDIAVQLVATVQEYEPVFAVVEGYVHTGRFVNAGQYELGALVRRALMGGGIPVCEASPTSVKKFATGGGKATKKQMLDYARRMGYEGKDHNQADAIALASMGAVLDGSTNLPMGGDVGVVEKLGNPLL